MTQKSANRSATNTRVKQEQRFWNSIAGNYDRYMQKSAKKTYGPLFEMLAEDTADSNSLLEVGAGTGTISLELSKHIPYITAIDLSPEMMDIARAKAERQPVHPILFQVGNAYDLKFPDGSFDTVIASNVLHLLTNPESALKEMKRVLKDNGRIIIPTYCHGENLISHIFSRCMNLFGFRARTRWSVASFGNFVENSGFEIMKCRIIKGTIPMAYMAARKSPENNNGRR